MKNEEQILRPVGKGGAGIRIPQFKNVEIPSGVMLEVLIALIPAAVFGCVMFGIRAVIILLFCVATAVLFEMVWCLAIKKPITVGDFSAVVTGLLLGMSLPSSLPVWIAPIGTLISIIIVKQIIGGLGYSFVNPVIVTRIILSAVFPASMTKFFIPTVVNAVDTVAAATPLTEISGEQVTVTFNDLFFGKYAGCIGETSSFLLIIGGLYLVIRKVISPIIPISFIGTVALGSLIWGDNVWLSVFGGGLIFGAIFMAGDFVNSPTSKLGKLLFGVGCGIITFAIRKLAFIPEGTACAILVMSILAHYLNKSTITKLLEMLKKLFDMVKSKLQKLPFFKKA